MQPARPEVRWARLTPYMLIHALALAALFEPVTARCLWVFALTYALKTFGASAGYHRYFSHRAFRLSRSGQFALGLLACTSLQNGPLWWAAHHRVHHRRSDQQGDPHSPREGFWWAQVLWIFAHRGKRLEEVRDLTRYPELVLLDRFNQLPALALGAGLWLGFGYAEFLWGFAASTVACWHASSAVNSLGHRFGTRPYATGDDSRNHWALALLTLGDGWHNNHHRHASSARHGFLWWELDLSYLALRALERVGLVSDLRPVPAEVIAERVSPGPSDRCIRPDSSPDSPGGTPRPSGTPQPA
jgi:stearoyl-CoA desaturase (Delta-9 desaturase)